MQRLLAAAEVYVSAEHLVHVVNENLLHAARLP